MFARRMGATPTAPVEVPECFQPAYVDTDHGDSKSSGHAKPLLFRAELLTCFRESTHCLRANTQAKSPSGNVYQESCGGTRSQKNQSVASVDPCLTVIGHLDCSMTLSGGQSRAVLRVQVRVHTSVGPCLTLDYAKLQLPQDLGSHWITLVTLIYHSLTAFSANSKSAGSRFNSWWAHQILRHPSPVRSGGNAG
jgi:cytochrome c biogenesis protein ResB